MNAPGLSLLMVVGPELMMAGPDAAGLAVTLATVFRSAEDNRWELVLAGEHEPPSLAALTPSTPHGRVRWVPAPPSADPTAACAAALEVALAAAGGEFVGVLGVGDIVEPGVLPAALDYLRRRPDVDVLYTDEQWPGTGAEGIFTKPGWNPEYVLGYPYLGRLCLVRRTSLVACGGFGVSPPQAEEWDAHLRVTDQGAVVEHLPAIGVTRPVAPVRDSVAGVRVVESHFRRCGVEADVEPGELAGSVRSWRAIPGRQLVSVIIPTIGTERAVRSEHVRLVTHCVESLLARTTYANWELVLVTSESTPPAAIEEVAAIAGDRLTVAPVAGSFNFSRSVNEGARVARGELLLFLNDDIEVIEPRWLERMVGVAQEPSIGVVGAKLLFEDGRVQHLGVVHNDAWEPAHAFEFTADDGAHFGMGLLDLDYLAVTGACLLTSRDVFEEVGGFTEALPLNYNDVDFCFKVLESGHRVVSTPTALLYHFESASRVPHLEPYERAHLRDQWAAVAYRDPFVNLREVR